MNPKQKKNIIERFKELQHFYFRKDRMEPEFSDKPFTNFLDLLYPILSKNEYYNDDIFVSSIISYLEELEEVSSDIDKLIIHIERNFELNKEMHYLVFPLQGSGFKKDISFSRFHMLTEKKESDMIKQISTITSIDIEEVKSFIEHTKRSRSTNFLDANIMIIEIENQTQNVRYSAHKSAQSVVNFLFLIHSAFGMESSIFRNVTRGEDENKHVAILSKDGWRCGHGFSWDAYLQCRLDLDFMEESKYQEIFDKLFNSFVLNNDNDELTYKFKNAFILYCKGYMQSKIYNDYSIALLLFITTLESLITEGQPEKRIRLAATIPKIVEIESINSNELATLIDSLYRKRNDFVHGGQIAGFSYENETLEVLNQVTALIILKYFDVEDLLSECNSTNRLNAWSEYLNDIFNSIIFA